MDFPPPPLPLRNTRTRLSANFPSLPDAPLISVQSGPTLTDLSLPHSSGNAQDEFPPMPPSPITDSEIALYHRKHASRGSLINTGTGSLRLGKHPQRNTCALTQSCSNPYTNNGVQDQTNSFSSKVGQTPQIFEIKQEMRSFPKQNTLSEPKLSKTPPSSDLSTYLPHNQFEEFNACSPPNDLLAACLNELTELQAYSGNQSESDSNGSNFSLHELSQLTSPAIPTINSTDCLDASLKSDDLKIEDLDALIADLDLMTQAILVPESQAASQVTENKIHSTNAAPVIPPKPLTKPLTLNFQSNKNPSQFSHDPTEQFDYTSPAETHIKEQLASRTAPTVDTDSKQAKISLALSKLKLANQKRVVLKIFDINMSYKMVVIDENMISRSVCSVMAEKNHQIPGPNWCLVESLGALGLERTLEDHERVLDVISHWPRQHSNVIIFKNISDKYLLLKKPHLFMPPNHPLSPENESKFDDATRRRILIKELFYDKTLPTIASVVHIKLGKRGSWKKIYCILRTSGLYYTKSKRASTKDLVNLVTWKNVRLYRGQKYSELYKSPDKFCCSLIPSGTLDQIEKSIVHLAFSNRQQLECWMACISLAKYSVQILKNYLDNFELYPWLENGGELTAHVPESDAIITPRSQESALTSEEKQMLHNELQMSSLTNSFIDPLGVIDDKKNKFNQSLDIDMKDSLRKSSKIAATFSNAWAAGDSALPPLPRTSALSPPEDPSVSKQQPFSYTHGIPPPAKFTLV